MKTSNSSGALITAGMWLLAAIAGATAPANADGVAAGKARTGTFVDFLGQRNLGASPHASTAHFPAHSLATVGSSTQVLSAQDAVQASASGGLPLWNFNVRSSRDGNVYRGTMVGTSPFTNPQSTSVRAIVIPLIFHVHSVATAVSASTGGLTLAPGDYTASPVARDQVCMSAPNNRPATVFMQSPLFNAVKFNFGGTEIGNTQYIDAVQRANFYYANPSVPNSYHVLFSPVHQIEAIEVDVPADEGAAVASSLIDSGLGVLPSGPGCGTLTVVDYTWFDQLLNTQLLPQLARDAGVAPANLPIFLIYNTVYSGGPPSVFFGGVCCYGGYHNLGGFPAPLQTYVVTDFDSTGEFGVAFANTAVAAHELGEWVNDPFSINNLVAPWGGVGQVGPGCEGNLEVGDPLTGTVVPTVAGTNGYTYDLQELAFFSWFLGAPSMAVNGWFSNNATLTTDAGTPCSLQ